MHWIDLDSFGIGVWPYRAAILTLPKRTGLAKDLHRLLEQYEGDIAALEQFVRTVVLGARPELQGFILWAVRFDLASQCWEFGIEHPSLVEVPCGAQLPSMRLFQE